jgi:hypothetical protein
VLKARRRAHATNCISDRGGVHARIREPGRRRQRPRSAAKRASPRCVISGIFYYPQYNRQIVLPAAMKVTVPGINIGRDRYCVSLGKAPRYDCSPKLITNGYNH